MAEEMFSLPDAIRGTWAWAGKENKSMAISMTGRTTRDFTPFHKTHFGNQYFGHILALDQLLTL